MEIWGEDMNRLTHSMTSLIEQMKLASEVE
jgi:hypothetical protein